VLAHGSRVCATSLPPGDAASVVKRAASPPVLATCCRR